MKERSQWNWGLIAIVVAYVVIIGVPLYIYVLGPYVVKPAAKATLNFFGVPHNNPQPVPVKSKVHNNSH